MTPKRCGTLGVGLVRQTLHGPNAGELRAFGGDAVAYADPGVGTGNWVTADGLAWAGHQNFRCLHWGCCVSNTQKCGLEKLGWGQQASGWVWGIGRGSCAQPHQPRNVVGKRGSEGYLAAARKLWPIPNMEPATVPSRAGNDVTKATKTGIRLISMDPREGGVRDVTLLTDHRQLQCQRAFMKNAVGN